jgi:hypothetical protein
MIDLVKLQEDWWYKLLSESALERINVKLLRKEVIANRVDFALLTKTVRNGRMGCAAVVEMPTFDVPQANAPGPQGAFELTTLVAEHPTLNMSAVSGTLESAEAVALKILDIGHRFFVRDVAEFVAARQALEPAQDFDQAGHVAYRVRFAFLHASEQSGRVLVPTAEELAPAEGLHTVTLTCGTAGADIFYTLDDSFPGVGNPGAVRYEAPFAVASGTVVRWAAYKAGLSGSDVDRATINY